MSTVSIRDAERAGYAGFARFAGDDPHAEFVDRLDRLARRMTESDRELLLEMAAKLAAHRSG